jgi:NAD(P)H-flavin reductase
MSLNYGKSLQEEESLPIHNVRRKPVPSPARLRTQSVRAEAVESTPVREFRLWLQSRLKTPTDLLQNAFSKSPYKALESEEAYFARGLGTYPALQENPFDDDYRSTSSGESEEEGVVEDDVALVDKESFEYFIRRSVNVLPLPEIEAHSRINHLRYKFFTVYRRLFSIVFISNVVVLIAILARYRTTTALVRAATANFVVCGLARQTHCINAMYRITCALPRSAPLWLRCRAAYVSHYGGVHSGCGVAAFFWYTGFVAMLTRDFVTQPLPLRPATAVIVLVYMVEFLLLSMMAVAYPIFRFLRHDVFELTHRFSSWIFLSFFWAAYFQLMHQASDLERVVLESLLIRDVTFWFAVILTVAIFSPWVTLRRVNVDPEYLSGHAIRLHFDYTATKFAQGVSIATNPLRDWHAFAGLRNQEGKGFSVVMSKAGDWTSACIKNQPRKMWKRAIPTYGSGHAVLLFRRVLIVATGSGIGPALSLLAAENRPPLRLLWQTREPHKTYGEKILSEVAQVDQNAVVIDSDRFGRQDMMPIIYSMVKDFDAEAVFIVSNPLVVTKLIYECEARGIPAFGPLFDS